MYGRLTLRYIAWHFFWGDNFIRVNKFLGCDDLGNIFLSSAIIRKANARDTCIENILAYTGNTYIKGIWAENNCNMGICTKYICMKTFCDKVTYIRIASMVETCG